MLIEWLNLWLIELCEAGVMPGEWLAPVTTWIYHLLMFVGFGPTAWG